MENTRDPKLQEHFDWLNTVFARARDKARGNDYNYVMNAEVYINTVLELVYGEE